MGCLTVIAALLGVFFWLWILETIDGTVWLTLGVMAAFIFIVVMMLGTVGSKSSHAQRKKQKWRLVNAKRIYASQCKLVKMEDGGWLIEKFVGMDEPIMEIPKEFDGIPIHGIGAWAFGNCANIEGIVIPEGIREIRHGAFYGCKQLRDVMLPSSLQYIGVDAFRNTALKECYLPEQIKTIEQGLFAETNLVRVEIPSHIILIKKEAFYNCKQLTSLTLHEGLIEIGDNAFRECTGLQRVTIPKSVKKIGKDAFSKIGYGNLDITIHCYPGSCGLQYARANRFAYKDVTKKK